MGVEELHHPQRRSNLTTTATPVDPTPRQQVVRRRITVADARLLLSTLPDDTLVSSLIVDFVATKVDVPEGGPDAA